MKTTKRVILLPIAATSLVASAAWAQQAPIEEIVVTARQREESLQEVPATITVFTEQELARAGVQRAEDFVGLTPGVTLVDAAEVGDTQVNIRGINGARDAENSFAFIVDGVLMTNPAAFNREYANLQQIEILKGPQGALYGRNAAAGAIIVTTREPTDELEGQVKVSAGNESSYYASANLGGPISEGSSYFQLGVDWRDTDGFFSNSFLGRDDIVDAFENYNINGRLLFTPSDRLKIDTKARYGEVDASAITFNSVFHLPAFTFLSPEFAEDVNEHDFVFPANIVSDNEQEAIEFSAKMDYELESGMMLTAWGLYSDIENNFLADGTSGAFGFFWFEPNCEASVTRLFNEGVTLPPPQFLGPSPVFPNSVFGAYTPTSCDGYQYQVRNQKDLSFEVRLASAGAQPLRWLAGVYYLDIEREVGVATGIDSTELAPGSFQQSLFIPAGQPNSTEQLVHDRFDSRVIAGFGQLAYDLTDTVELSLALRYDHEERDVTNLVPVDARNLFIDFDGPPFEGNAPLNPGLDPVINPGGIQPQSETFDQFQPKVSATWDLTPEWTLFANWGIGFKSGGFNNQGSATTVDIFVNSVAAAGDFPETVFPPVVIRDRFDEETSSAWELGFKSVLADSRLRLEGAVFRTDVDDMQFFEFFVGAFGLLRVVSNIDEVDIQGVELGGYWAATDWLSLHAGGSVIDSEIQSYASRPDAVGNKSPYTADYTVNAGADFDVPISADFDLVARVDWRRTGPTWFHTIQDNRRPTIFGFAGDNSLTEREAFDVVNLRVGIESEQWSVSAFARNLFDEEYLEEVIPAPEFGGTFDHPAARRSYGVEASYRF
jgi:iron complex outermembrane recepter protein